MMSSLWLWIAFLVFVLAMLALDLGVFNREDHVIRAREALAWTLFWIVLSLAFNVLVYFIYDRHWFGMNVGPGALSGRTAAIQYLTGYVIEKSLSLDNIFVIALIFSYFKVPAQYQHRVLFWGILGALIMRGAMIAAGTALIARFSWTIYVFGGFLIFTALRMLMGGDEPPDLEHNRLVRWTRKLYPVSDKLDGHSFFTHLGAKGKRAITPLFLVLLLVESSDVIFAVDSIPAIFAVTLDPFIVFTSNIFAILGLRSLYFVLARLIDSFHFFKLSLVVVLAYVGVKMVISPHLHIPSWVSLLVIVGVLLVGVVASLIRARLHPDEPADDDPTQGPEPGP